MGDVHCIVLQTLVIRILQISVNQFQNYLLNLNVSPGEATPEVNQLGNTNFSNLDESVIHFKCFNTILISY